MEAAVVIGMGTLTALFIVLSWIQAGQVAHLERLVKVQSEALARKGVFILRGRRVWRGLLPTNEYVAEAKIPATRTSSPNGGESK